MLLVFIKARKLLQVEVLEQRFLLGQSGKSMRGRESGSHHCLPWCTYKVRIKSSTSKEIR